VIRAKLDRLDRKGRLALAVRLDRSEQLDKQACREWRAKKVKPVHPDRKGLLERVAKWELWALQDQRGVWVKRVRPGHLDPRVRRAREARPD